jgi:hypothetical protein
VLRAVEFARHVLLGGFLERPARSEHQRGQRGSQAQAAPGHVRRHAEPSRSHTAARAPPGTCQTTPGQSPRPAGASAVPAARPPAGLAILTVRTLRPDRSGNVTGQHAAGGPEATRGPSPSPARPSAPSASGTAPAPQRRLLRLDPVVQPDLRSGLVALTPAGYSTVANGNPGKRRQPPDWTPTAPKRVICTRQGASPTRPSAAPSRRSERTSGRGRPKPVTLCDTSWLKLAISSERDGRVRHVKNPGLCRSRRAGPLPRPGQRAGRRGSFSPVYRFQCR